MRAFLSCLLVLILPAVSNSQTAHFWSRSFGAASNEGVSSLAVDPATGDIIAGGYFNDTVDFGGVTLTATSGSADAWLARFSSSGDLLWARAYGYQAAADNIADLALDSYGDIYITGSMNGFVDFGGGAINGGGNTDIFLVKLDRFGNHIWSRGFGGTGDQYVTKLAVDGSGNAVICGSFAATSNFGGANVPWAGSTDVFVVKYDNNGNFQWHATAGSPTGEDMYGVAIDGVGNVYATGFFTSTLVFFAPTPLTTAGGADMFLVKYNSAGGYVWSQQGGLSGDDLPLDLAVNASGATFVVGGFVGTTNLGGSNISAGGGYDGFLASYTASGNHVWSSGFGGAGTDAVYDIRFGSSGDLVFCGVSSEGADLGGGMLSNAGNSDIFLARYTANGAHVWSRAAGGAGFENAFAIAEDPAGNVVTGGNFQSVTNLGGSVLPFAGGEDAFLARYGLAEPAITAITDVGNDQGRSVRIALTGSGMDDGTADLPIEEYQAFRRIKALPANLAGAHAIAPAGDWEYVTAVPAGNAPSYFMIAPTLADSSVVLGPYYSVFFVRAATSDPSVFFDSAPDSGYSVDNLAPGVPQNLLYAAGALSWDESTAGDFDYFTVYGGATSDFGAATLIDYSVDPTLNVSLSPYTHYFVTATDFSGNEGSPGILVVTSNVAESPRHYTLSVSAYPNPFNPATTVRYTVPARGHALVAVHDINGARVKTLVDGPHDGGAFTVTWDGRDDRGVAVASGVYFARLITDTGQRAYKLVLLK